MWAPVAQLVRLPGFCAGDPGSIPGPGHETFKVSKPGSQPRDSDDHVKWRSHVRGDEYLVHVKEPMTLIVKEKGLVPVSMVSSVP